MAQLSLHRLVQIDEVVVFLKDTRRIHQPGRSITLKEMIQTARGPAQFSCGVEPIPPFGFRYANMSIWHKTEHLSKFKLDKYTRDIYKPKQRASSDFKYTNGNFRTWSENLGVRLRSRKVTPVCYGGVFATLGGQITAYSYEFWYNIEQSLGRGDSIEEGHFMERLWAHILLYRTSQLDDETILRHAEHTIKHEYRGLQGTLYGCRKTRIDQP
jgi:hypothetical protein